MTPQEERERAEWRLKKHLEIKQELQQNEKLKDYLEGTYPNARAEFIDSYASQKVHWLEWGPKFREWMEREDLQWVEDATDRLKEIQQKKLFDQQCLWRAEKIELPEIKLTHDFYTWEKDILNCPFIEPVTEGEVDLYIQYLQSENFENEQSFLDRWQDYQGIKEAYNSENANRNFPDWYDFHNGRTGLGVYLLLPDVRGEKEKFYFLLWQKEFQAQQEERRKKEEEEKRKHPAGAVTEPKRPPLGYHHKGWFTWFVKTFEDKETQEMFERYGGERAFDDHDELLKDNLELLGRADHILPITGWFDWREAIHKAADRYRREKIIEALPTAYGQYRMNVDLQIPFEKPAPNLLLDNNWYTRAILRGRELNGEPQDFNF